MFAVYAYLWFMMSPVQEVLSIQYSYYSANASLSRLNKLLELKQEPQYEHKQDPFKGKHTVDLSWSGATGANVDIFRDGVKIATVANTGAYTDNIGAKGGATYVYQVWETDGSACSNTSSVVF